jgi:uncharacterized protein (DUF849 family)
MDLSRREFLVAGTGIVGFPLTQTRTGRTMLLKACINGARQAGVHPALPTTPAAMASAAAASIAAGAGAVHLHVRGPDRSESLNGGDVASTLTAVRAAIRSVPVGVSTGLWIVGDPEKRQALVSAWSVLPDFASVNFNEARSPALASLLIDRGVGVEAGLPTAAAAEELARSGLGPRCLRILIEPQGRDVAVALGIVRDIEAILDRTGITRARLLHSSGAAAWPVIDEAARRGYDTRAGLEDTLEMPDGRSAPDNAAIVAEAKRRIARAVAP